MKRRSAFRTQILGLSCAVLVGAALGPSAPAVAQCGADELVKRLASDASEGARFGRSVSVSGNVAVIGAYTAGSSGAFMFDGPGAAYVLRLAGGNWVEQAALTPSDSIPQHWFGYAVAVDGDVAVIGAIGDDQNGSASGAAYAFRFDGNDWIEEAKLVASNGVRNDEFGTSVAVSGDVAVIGAPQNSLTESGSAYVYRFDGTGWVEQAELVGSDTDGTVRDEFGNAVAISTDVIVVGAWNHGNTTPSFPDGTGAAYVYRFDGTRWLEETKLVSTAPLPGQRDRFGKSVSISADASVIAIGTEPISIAPPSPVGAAYVFRFDGSSWVSEAKLVASDAAGGDRFGASVSLGGDVLLVGAWGEYSSPIPCTQSPVLGGVCNAGSAYVYLRKQTGWVEQAKLVPSDVMEGDLFAWSVALSGDTAVIGAWRDGDAGPDTGSAYAFRALGDCDANGTLDLCDLAAGTSQDSNANGIPDACECPGDVDGDADADLSDLAIILSNFGQTGAGLADGDLNANGQVDLSDLAIVLANFGRTCG